MPANLSNARAKIPFESCRSVTRDLAVGRWGRYWRVIDKATGSEIGPPFPSMWEAREYAEHRQETTYGGTQ